MIELFSQLFVRLIHEGQLSRFGPHTQAPQIAQYISQLGASFDCAIEVLLIAGVYLIRLHNSTCRDINVYNAILTSVGLAFKFLNDERLNMRLLAASCGMRVEDLIRLELNALEVLKFRLFVTTEEFDAIKWYVNREAMRSVMRVDTARNSTAYAPNVDEAQAASLQDASQSNHTDDFMDCSFDMDLTLVDQHLCSTISPPRHSALDWMSFVNTCSVDLSSWSHTPALWQSGHAASGVASVTTQK
eukprot:c18369_g1_i1.p1 GENE.c18369_g1_i1~~c18369_g1_i1.p1  ORF type:complete len:245 (-),score=30.24 c18369_g1_i1:12-746(-)